MESARAAALSVDILPEQLPGFLAEKQAQHDQLCQELAASSANLDNLVQESRQVLVQLQQRARDAKAEYAKLEDDVIDFRDEITSPLSSRSKDGRDATETSRTLVERLQAMHDRIQALEDAHTLFGYLAKAEELALIAKEQIKLPSPDDAFQTYRELVEFVHTTSRLPASTSKSLKITPFVREIASDAWQELVKALQSELVKTLDGLAWPTKKIDPNTLDYQYDSKAKAFKSAFSNLARLEEVGRQHPLPRTAGASVQEEPTCLPVAALAQPLTLRFRYHFDGKRQTNRLDKPEWYFAHVLNAFSEHEPFIRQDIQTLLRQSGNTHDDAMQAFIGGLRRPLQRKIRSSVPQLLGLPSILGHTIYQALQFDTTVKDSFGYTGGLDKAGKPLWKGTADIILGNQAWFSGWKDAEKKFIDDKYFEIISAADAWHINEDYASTSSSSSASADNVLRPTNSALRIRDLFDQVTDRYRSLPSFSHRLPFLIDIQLPLLDSYLQRISSATDAFETLSFGLIRAVPGSLAGGEGGAGSARLTNGINGLQRLVRARVSASWMEATCKEWAEDVFFLDLWQEIREAAITDAGVRLRCKTLLDHAATSAASTHAHHGVIGIFDVLVTEFRNLSDRIEGLIVKHVIREVQGELKSYLARRWDVSFEGEADSISPDLAGAIAVFSALLGLVARSLPAVAVNKLYRSIASQIQDLLITRSVLPKIWSERGGLQFLFDAESGWLSSAREALGSKVRRPENGLRKLLDAARLVSLPASTGSARPEDGARRDEITISKVVQVTWDDTNDAAFNEILMKLGIRELIGRKDVKAILRKRPECWR